jgi:hypothetical protein
MAVLSRLAGTTVPHPSCFRLRPWFFILHPSAFILGSSSFILPPSSFILAYEACLDH